MKTYYVYIMTNLSETLYTSLTDNLKQRVHDYKQKLNPGFARIYNTTKLVYFEEEKNIDAAWHEKTNQRLAACQENFIDRIKKSGMERFEFRLI